MDVPYPVHVKGWGILGKSNIIFVHPKCDTPVQQIMAIKIWVTMKDITGGKVVLANLYVSCIAADQLRLKPNP